MGEPHAPARKDAPESVPQERAEPPSGFKDVPSSAPAAPPPPPPAKRRDDASDLLKQDRAKVEAKKPAEPQAAPRAEHDEGSGVPGGVVGGVAGGVQGGTAEDEDVALQKEERQANDELTRKVSTTPAPAPTAAAVKESLASVCGTDVADAPARASWVVRDRAAATRQLAALAAGHGGALQQPDPSAPGQLVVVVPTSRYDAFLAAARATGVQIEGATVPPGGTCVRQRIDLAPPPAD
jgi:hypothetical protein